MYKKICQELFLKIFELNNIEEPEPIYECFEIWRPWCCDLATYSSIVKLEISEHYLCCLHNLKDSRTGRSSSRQC